MRMFSQRNKTVVSAIEGCILFPGFLFQQMTHQCHPVPTQEAEGKMQFLCWELVQRLFDVLSVHQHGYGKSQSSMNEPFSKVMWTITKMDTIWGIPKMQHAKLAISSKGKDVWLPMFFSWFTQLSFTDFLNQSGIFHLSRIKIHTYKRGLEEIPYSFCRCLWWSPNVGPTLEDDFLRQIPDASGKVSPKLSSIHHHCSITLWQTFT